MPLNESASFLVSTVLSVLTFSTMQILKPAIASTPVMTVAGGLIGALLFLFLLTAVGNLEKCLFGAGFASKWAEVSACLLIAVAASGSVHRVSATWEALAMRKLLLKILMKILLRFPSLRYSYDTLGWSF